MSYQEVHLLSSQNESRSGDDLINELSKFSEQSIIIIEGDVGIGKTYLLKYVNEKVEKWIYLNLEETHFHQNEENLMAHFDKKDPSEEHFVFLLDGFNEFNKKCKWDKALFYSRINDEVSKNTTVLIATRPSGIDHLYDHFCDVMKHYTIQGFFTATVEEDDDIKQFFKIITKFEEFQQINALLEEHSVLREMCKIPLICTELLNVLKVKKFRTLQLTLTRIVYEIICAIMTRECNKFGEGEVKIDSLHSSPEEYKKSVQVISELALADLTDKTKHNSMIFLSTFCLENQISSLDEIEKLGMVEFCKYPSVCADIKKALYWFPVPPIRDFFAAFALHNWPPLDQLYFLTEHVRELLSGEYHGWLQFFYGLSVQKGDEYNPTRMMMASLNELLVHCLNLEEESLHLRVFSKCLMETQESTLWKKLGVKCGKIFDIELLIGEDKSITSLVDMINHSGFKEWIIEFHPDNFGFVRNFALYTGIPIIQHENTSLSNQTIQLKPRSITSVSSRRQRTTGQSTRGDFESQDERFKLDLLYCRAIREILQRVLQLFSTLKLKGDASNPAYISFLSCKCFEKAFEDGVTFNPIVPMHFLPVENDPNKVKSRRRDVTSVHLNEFHNGKAMELVIFLKPHLKCIQFILPNSTEEFEIVLSGKSLPDNVYERLLSTLYEFEELVQCNVAEELIPLKTESVLPSMLIPTLESDVAGVTVAPIIFLPSNTITASTTEQAQNQVETTLADTVVESDGVVTESLLIQSQDSMGYNPRDQETSVTQRPSLMTQSPIMTQYDSPMEETAVRPTERSRTPTAMRPGTVVFTSIPEKIACNRIYPLPDEDILISSGGNGQIFAGTIRGVNVAIKKTAYRSKEYAIMTKLKHKNVMPLLAFMWGKENPLHKRRYHCYHIMPKMTGDLANMVTNNPNLILKRLHQAHKGNPRLMGTIQGNVHYILSHILQGLAYLHSLHIVHRDLKSSNILLKFHCSCEHPLECSCEVKYVLVICDFDAAIQLDSNDQLPPASFSSSRLSAQQLLAMAPQYHCIPVGTNGFRAPESSMHITSSSPDCFSPPISTKCDIFSFGVLCLRLMVGREGPESQKSLSMTLLHYYQTQNLVEGKSRNNALRIPPSKVQKILKVPTLRREMKWLRHASDFVECCLRVDPMERHMAKELLDHPFFQSHYAIEHLSL